MNYLSVCSGIEAATVAWHSLGWTPLAFSEIEKFPSQVLAHHYPNTPNLGDMTQFKEWNFESDVNVLVGGTPCQSFSVAGLRKGLDDPRGNLMLTYLAIAAKQRPKWVVWENVPGVLSSNGGLDFASFLRGLGQLGYGFAYRVLDAQYFGVAQRRRRVFVVGCAGDWRAAAAVLFERHSLQGHPAPSREKGQGASATITARTGVSRNNYEECLSTYSTPAIGSIREDSLSSCITKNTGGGGESQNPAFVLQPIALQDVRAVEKMQNGKGWNDDGTAYTVDTHATQGVMQPIPIDTMNIRGRPSDDGRGNRIGRGYGEVGDPMFTITKANHHAVCLMDQGGSVMTIENDITGTLRRETHGHEPVVMQPIAFDAYNQTTSDTVSALRCAAGGVFDNTIAQAMAFDWQSGGDARGLDPKPTAQLQRSQTPAVMQPVYSFKQASAQQKSTNSVLNGLSNTLTAGSNNFLGGQAMAVRRLTPVECERLQGFPDGYTDIQPKGKATPDGPRYKALGNSMAVPVMAWIGERIAQVEGIA